MPNGKRPKPVKPAVGPVRRGGVWSRYGAKFLRDMMNIPREMGPPLPPGTPAERAWAGLTDWWLGEEEIMPLDWPEGYKGAATYYTDVPWDVTETQWGGEQGPYTWGTRYPTVRGPEEIGQIAELNRARLEQMQAAQAGGVGAMAPEQGAGGAGRTPSQPNLGGLINLATPEWWGEFERVHRQSPQEYYTRYENRIWGGSWQQAVNVDLSWAEGMRRRNVRTGVGNVGPSPGEWIQHYYQVRGIRQPSRERMRQDTAALLRQTGGR